MANAKARIVTGLAVTVLGAALFATASAYVVDHDYNKIAAAIVGAFAFPVAPLGWHLLSERRRRKRLAEAKARAKSSLTGADRYWFRFLVVALVVLGPMFAASRLAVFGAVWRHGLWFVPASPPDLSSVGAGPARDFKDQAELLKRVPSDAELVIVGHQKAENGKPGGSIVVAWGGHQAMIVADAGLDDGEPLSKKLDEINANRDKLPWLSVDKLEEIKTSDKTILVATEGWRSKVDPAGTGPSEELRGELSRAPQSAPLVFAVTPRTKLTPHDLDPDMIRHGAAWVDSNDDGIVIATRFEMRDEAAAKKIVAEVDDVLHFKTKDIPENCREPVSKIVDRIHLDQHGTIVTGRAEIPGEALMGLMFCAMK
jgi:hypothetical protein